jgi:hypothetical protein
MGRLPQREKRIISDWDGKISGLDLRLGPAIFRTRIAQAIFGLRPGYPIRYCSRLPPRFKVELNSMKNRTETLEVGSTAPDFSLCAANREGMFSLGNFLKQGPLILEFLRGTW